MTDQTALEHATTSVGRPRAGRLPRRIVTALVAVALVAFGTATISAPTAYADPNGCGPAGSVISKFVPDSPLGFDFTPACNQHDNCYSGGTTAKADCDLNFYEDLLDFSCDGDSICDAIAWIYYEAVNWFGQRAFDKARQHHSELTEDISDCGEEGECAQDGISDWESDQLVGGLEGCSDDGCEGAVEYSYDNGGYGGGGPVFDPVDD